MHVLRSSIDSPDSDQQLPLSLCLPLRGNKRVVMVDSSDEIAGGGMQTHPCVGQARRLPACSRSQAAVALEAVQNHNPQAGPEQDQARMAKLWLLLI